MSVGFGVQAPGFGLDSFGDPPALFVPFILGTGVVVQPQSIAGITTSRIQSSGSASTVQLSAGSAKSNIQSSGQVNAVINIGGGVIG